jgi:hypothetical protein
MTTMVIIITISHITVHFLPVVHMAMLGFEFLLVSPWACDATPAEFFLLKLDI